MPRRRFNWKLALVLLIGLVVLGTSGYVLRRWHRSRRAEQGLILGNKAYQEQRWEEAASRLGRYISMVQDNVPALLKYAEAQLKIRPLKSGNLAQAVSAYRIALRVEPDNSEAAARLTEIYLQMGTPSEAELIARRSLSSNESVDIRRLLAISLIGQRKTREAEQELTDIINKHPEQVIAYEILGQLTEQRPDDLSKPAEYWFEQAVENNPSSALAYIVRGSFNFRRTNRTEAKADFTQAERLDLSEPQVRLRLAGEFVKMNEFEKAEQHLIAVQESEPANQSLWQIWAELAMKSGSEQQMLQVAQNGLEALASQPWDFMPVAAELFIRTNKLDLAAECIGKLRQKDIAPPSTTFLEGLLADKEGRTFEAVRLWQQAMQLGNKSPGLRSKLASALWQLGDHQSAILELHTLVSQSPDFLEGRLNLAQVLAQIGNWQESAEQARLAMRLAPGSVDAALLFARAQIYRLAESQIEKDSPLWVGLQDQLTALEEATGKSAEVKFLQFNLAMKRGDLAEAETILATIKQDYPTNVQVFLAEAELLALQGKEGEAVSILVEATSKFTDEIAPVRHLAVLLSQSGQMRESEKVVKDALVRNDDPLAQRTLCLFLAELYNQWGQQEKVYQLLSSKAERYANDIPIKRRLLGCQQLVNEPEKAQQIVYDIKSREGENGWQWRYEQAKLCFSGNDFERRYPEVVSLLKENLLANPDDQSSRVLLAAAYEKAGQLPLAISVYQEALNRSPRDLRIIIPAIAALYKANEYDRADEILRQAADQKLFHPELRKFELRSYLRRGELASAGNVLEDMLIQDPNSRSVCLSLALLKIQQNSFAEAEELLDRLKGQEPDYLPVIAAQIELNLRQDKAAEALQLCDEAVNVHNNASAYLLRGRVYAGLGQIEQAQRDFDYACSLEPNNVGVWVSKSDFHRTAGSYAEAVSCIRKAISVQPDNPEVCKRAISLLSASDRPEMISEGKDLLERALTSHPEDVGLRIYKARYLLSEGTAPSVRQASDILQEITQEQPKLSESWLLLGAIALNQGQPAKAIDISLQGLVHKPDDKSLLTLKARAEAMRSPALAIPTLRAMLEMEPGDTDTVVLLSETYVKAGQAAKAVSLLKNHLAGCDNDSDRRRVNIALAVALYKDGNHADAQSRFDSLYQSDPADHTVLLTQVRLLREDQLWDQLEQKVTQWSDSHQDNSMPLLIANDLAGDHNDKAKEIAEKLLRSYLDNNPQDLSAMSKLAMLLQTTGRNSESAKLYQQILTLHPDNKIAINNLAWILCEQEGKYEQALELAQRGLEIDSSYVDLIDTRGAIYYKLAQYDNAVRDFRRSLELYPDTSPAKATTCLHLAKTLIRLGQKGDAEANLERALELHGQSGGLSASEYAEVKNLLETISGRA